MKRPFGIEFKCPNCGQSDQLAVELEMIGTMYIPVRDGVKITSEQEFIGDTWEKVVCVKCDRDITEEIDPQDLEKE